MATATATWEHLEKSLRMWETWKLNHNTVEESHLRTSVWERMSKHDQEFNLEWNKLRKIVFDTSLPKLKKIVEFAESL